MPQRNLSFFHKNSNATKFMRINKIALKRNIKQMKLYGSVNHSFIKLHSSRPVEHCAHFLLFTLGTLACQFNEQWEIKLKNFRGGKNFITDWLHQSVSLKFRFSLPPKKVSYETHFVDGSVSFHIRINYWQHKTDTSEQLLCYRISNTSPPALRPKPF